MKVKEVKLKGIEAYLLDENLNKELMQYPDIPLAYELRLTEDDDWHAE